MNPGRIDPERTDVLGCRHVTCRDVRETVGVQSQSPASQSIEAAFELYESLKNDSSEFINQRIKITKMINKRSKFNYFAFHLSNPFMTFARDLTIKHLVKNKKFIGGYLGKIY